jgi:hypothetical protein
MMAWTEFSATEVHVAQGLQSAEALVDVFDFKNTHC